MLVVRPQSFDAVSAFLESCDDELRHGIAHAVDAAFGAIDGQFTVLMQPVTVRKRSGCWLARLTGSKLMKACKKVVSICAGQVSPRPIDVDAAGGGLKGLPKFSCGEHPTVIPLNTAIVTQSEAVEWLSSRSTWAPLASWVLQQDLLVDHYPLLRWAVETASIVPLGVLHAVNLFCR